MWWKLDLAPTVTKTPDLDGAWSACSGKDASSVAMISAYTMKFGQLCMESCNVRCVYIERLRLDTVINNVSAAR